MTDVILTGYVGTGKTTVGRLLANRFGLRFIDTDDEIERRAGMTISDYWASHAEPAFRELEAEVFADLMASGSGRVIATGAGLLISERNRVLLREHHRVISLTCAADELQTRLWASRSQRPHLAAVPAEDFAVAVGSRFEQRRPIYDQFGSIDTTDRTPDEVAIALGMRLGLQQAGSLTMGNSSRTELLFEAGSLDRLGDILRAHELRGQVLLISDEAIQQAGWVERTDGALRQAGFQVHIGIIPPGEDHKNLAQIERLLSICMAAELDRDAIILGLGGGVVGDMAGFVAAIYLRGLRLVHAPTTLLAQVDAAIGGKVGVDLAGAKNLIGAFYPASLVVTDPAVLRTLPLSALSDGLAEIVKTGWMLSSELLAQVECLQDPASVLDNPDVIRRTAIEKIGVVARDPYEHGERALLNFGHTIGHALEACSGYRLSHGQAISAGMVAETWLSEQLQVAQDPLMPRLTSLLQRFGLPTATPGLDPDNVFRFLRQDKKRRDGGLRFALPRQAGQGEVVAVKDDASRTAIDYVLGESH